MRESKDIKKPKKSENTDVSTEDSHLNMPLDTLNNTDYSSTEEHAATETDTSHQSIPGTAVNTERDRSSEKEKLAKKQKSIKSDEPTENAVDGKEDKDLDTETPEGRLRMRNEMAKIIGEQKIKCDKCNSGYIGIGRSGYLKTGEYTYGFKCRKSSCRKPVGFFVSVPDQNNLDWSVFPPKNSIPGPLKLFEKNPNLDSSAEKTAEKKAARRKEEAQPPAIKKQMVEEYSSFNNTPMDEEENKAICDSVLLETNEDFLDYENTEKEDTYEEIKYLFKAFQEDLKHSITELRNEMMHDLVGLRDEIKHEIQRVSNNIQHNVKQQISEYGRESAQHIKKLCGKASKNTL
ncbi:hypothetical protein NEPAR04_0967 [Nematocida parisii]|nr:hypothetical protein NEPAR08_0794 [Nematocida parisii]KAI5127306.1 hypothetical protein NEPAR03_0910 [Nematocida parisii]KAI5141414.1 hypothetical protein NEPAR04_0967 [Nematocida parisii]